MPSAMRAAVLARRLRSAQRGTGRPPGSARRSGPTTERRWPASGLRRRVEVEREGQHGLEASFQLVGRHRLGLAGQDAVAGPLRLESGHGAHREFLGVGHADADDARGAGGVDALHGVEPQHGPPALRELVERVQHVGAATGAFGVVEGIGSMPRRAVGGGGRVGEEPEVEHHMPGRGEEA